MGRERRGASRATGRPRRADLARLGRVAAAGQADCLRRACLDAAVLDERGELFSYGLVHAHLRLARPRPERRRRVRGPPRPRLRGLLRDRGVRLRAAFLEALRDPLAGRILDPDRGRRDGARRALARVDLAPAPRGLPRDRDALLRPGIRRVRQQREPEGGRRGADRRSERNPRCRPAELLRLQAPLDQAVLLPPAHRLFRSRWPASTS